MADQRSQFKPIGPFRRGFTGDDPARETRKAEQRQAEREREARLEKLRDRIQDAHGPIDPEALAELANAIRALPQRLGLRTNYLDIESLALKHLITALTCGAFSSPEYSVLRDELAQWPHFSTVAYSLAGGRDKFPSEFGSVVTHGCAIVADAIDRQCGKTMPDGLLELHIEILKEHSKYSHAIKIVDLATGARMKSETTCKAYVTKLIEMGYLYRPRPRSGTMITDEGRKRIGLPLGDSAPKT